MRAIMLFAGLLLATSAVAAPAERKDVGEVMKALSMGNLADNAVAPLVEQLPGMQEQSAAGKACAAGQVSRLMGEQFQQDIAEALGDDGAQLMGEWKRFLATPAGADMVRTFQATAAAAASGEEPVEPAMDDASKRKITEFMGKPAFQRFMQGFDGSQPPADFSQRIIDALQSKCGIALDPEQVS